MSGPKVRPLLTRSKEFVRCQADEVEVLAFTARAKFRGGGIWKEKKIDVDVGCRVQEDRVSPKVERTPMLMAVGGSWERVFKGGGVA